MFKKILLCASVFALSIPAWATTFEERIKMPTWGDATFHCEANPNWTVAYYYHPTTGEKVVKYWEAVTINGSPYQVEYTEVDLETFRKTCGVNKYEAKFLKAQSLREIDRTATPTIVGPKDARSRSRIPE